MRLIVSAFALLVFASLVPVARGEELSAQLDHLLAKLNDDNFQTREAATQAIADLPAESYPLVQAALKREGLSAEVRKRLETAANALHLTAQRVTADARKAAQKAYDEKTILEAYEKAGHKDPKWDDFARAALRQIVNWSIKDPRYQFNEDLALDYCNKAIAAGCDDPMILLHRQHMLYVIKIEKRGDNPHTDMIEAFAGSGYSLWMKFFALVRGAEWALAMKDDESRDKAAVYLEKAFAMLPEIVRDPDAPTEALLRRCYWWVNSAAMLGKVRREALERMSAALIKDCPRKTLPFLVKAWFFLNSAATAESDEDKKEWATEAEKELTEALKIDPANPIALSQMISVCSWLRKDRTTMEQWFKRAMDSDPYNFRAIDEKAHYLDPKGMGSKEALLEFGRECVKTASWNGAIPFALVDIHRELAGKGDVAPYYKDPDVWKEVAAVYEEWLKRFPDADYEHAAYAKLAALTEHWDIAVREFKALDEHAPIRRIYKDRAEYDGLRKLALEHAAEKK